WRPQPSGNSWGCSGPVRRPPWSSGRWSHWPWRCRAAAWPSAPGWSRRRRRRGRRWREPKRAWPADSGARLSGGACARPGHGYRIAMADLTADLTDKTVAIIAVDFVEDAELTTPRDALREMGAAVQVFSPDGSPIQAAEGDTEPTRKIEVHGTFGDVDV